MSNLTQLKAARVVSVVSATFISLACGTNYVYSAWGPQFAQRLQLTSTQSNLIGTFGNLGMYATGIPIGLLVDRKGPRYGLALGAILLGAGYYPIKIAYDQGVGSFPVAALCIFSIFTGAGGCAAFSAALKTAALNFPEHRGTATAFPLSAFGLSAFFFSMISKLAFPDDTSKFLLMLSTGTFLLVCVSSLFLRILPPSPYKALADQDRRYSDTQALHRTKSANNRHRYIVNPPGAPQISQSPSTSGTTQVTTRHTQGDVIEEDVPENRTSEISETSSLLSKSDIESHIEQSSSDHHHYSIYTDVSGLEMLKKVEFWQLFLHMGILTGIGLMTINNIGNDAQALWRHYDDTVSDVYIQERQLLHVALLSFCSFAGRLFSGIGSDILVKKLHASRYWCIFFSAVLFCIAQVLAMTVENPHFLGVVSAVTGFAYGFLFGCFPSIVAHTFGVNVMSQNWGTMTMAPVISGNIFNPIYGAIYDKHSTVAREGHRECLEGLKCYRTAYTVTFFSGIIGLIVALWSIRTERRRMERSQGHRDLPLPRDP